MAVAVVAWWLVAPIRCICNIDIVSLNLITAIVTRIPHHANLLIMRDIWIQISMRRNGQRPIVKLPMVLQEQRDLDLFVLKKSQENCAKGHQIRLGKLQGVRVRHRAFILLF